MRLTHLEIRKARFGGSWPATSSCQQLIGLAICQGAVDRTLSVARTPHAVPKQFVLLDKCFPPDHGPTPPLSGGTGRQTQPPRPDLCASSDDVQRNWPANLTPTGNRAYDFQGGSSASTRCGATCGVRRTGRSYVSRIWRVLRVPLQPPAVEPAPFANALAWHFLSYLRRLRSLDSRPGARRRWEAEFEEFVRRGTVPTLMISLTPQMDHTAATRPGYPDAESYGGGQRPPLIVQRVRCADLAGDGLFHQEDDAQDGPDMSTPIAPCLGSPRPTSTRLVATASTHGLDAADQWTISVSHR